MLNPSGLCQCGCGQKTSIAPAPSPGYAKGDPRMYIRGHAVVGKRWTRTKLPDPPNPSGICMCGCGERTPIAPRTHRAFGIVEGEHLRYCKGHQSRKEADSFEPRSCACGCGKTTSKIRWSDEPRGLVRGQYREYINGHYNRKPTEITENDYELEDRGFVTECWIWSGHVDRKGYPIRQRSREGERAGTTRAHRISYEQFFGPIQDGMTIHHVCRQTRCINPGHLEPMSISDNTYDSLRNRMSRKTRQRIITRDGGICGVCGTHEELTVDHIVPLSRGGANDDSNLQTLCRRCNSRKGRFLLTPGGVNRN